MHVWNLCVRRVEWTSGIINKMLFHVWIVPFSQKDCGACTIAVVSDQWNPMVNDENPTQSQKKDSFSPRSTLISKTPTDIGARPAMWFGKLAPTQDPKLQPKMLWVQMLKWLCGCGY